MKWIGLTGGMGTGKSTVAGLLRKRGLPVVDADLIAREVVEPGTSGLEEIVKVFGRGVLDQNGRLDRKRLGQIVFGDSRRLSQLETILHPRIRTAVDLSRAKFESLGHKIAFYDVPLLFEKKMEDLFDSVIVVSCNPNNQVSRIQSRTGLSLEEIEARIKAQMNLAEKCRRATYVLQNDSSLEDLKKAVDKLLIDLNYQPQE